MKLGQAILLVSASTLFALLLSEAALRLFTPYGRTSAKIEVATTGANRNLDTSDGARYADRLPIAAGTDRAWFREDPPPLASRGKPNPELVTRFQDFERRGIFPPQSEYIWNRYYVEAERCRPGVFRKYPDTLLAFDPPVVGVYPHYRFPPSSTLVEGLITNEFGLRGGPLTLAKPARTVRIAFAGASTTINHDLLFSYPDRVVYWLNRFAQANHFDVHFETLNGGREGFNSTDIATVMREELLPLDPDFAVYYEGSNQFTTATLLASPRIPPREDVDPRDPITVHKVPELLRAHLATADLLDRALNRFRPVGEPRRPFYRLEWPAGVDEKNPDPDSARLPLELPRIIKDIDSVRASIESNGGRLMLCSFVWLAADGMPLSPTRHKHIYRQLNTVLWPLRYRDIRRLADFQNRVFQRYAAVRGVTFTDVASAMPQDPDLFTDAIHMTDAGERLKAWIIFQQLVPLVRRGIESGQLPRPRATRPLPPPPNFAEHEMSTRCEDPTGPVSRIAGAVSLDAVERAYQEAVVELGPPVKVITAAQQWAYAAAIPLHVPANLASTGFLLVRARVLKGKIGLGVLDSQNQTFQVERYVSPSPGMIDTYVPVPLPDRAGTLIIRNVAEGQTKSEIQIEDVALVTGSLR